MMKSAAAACCLAALGSAAVAQSSVTVSGIVDSALRHVDNDGAAGAVTSLVSGSNSTSRLIFRGIEDLGGGLSAGFHLEHGLLADSGAAASNTKFWDRHSYVRLISRQAGELRLGRDFIPSYTSWSRFDPFSYVGIARTANFFVTGTAAAPTPMRPGGISTQVRTDNAVQYFSPVWNGFDLNLLVAAGEGGVDPSAKVMGGRASYASGPLSLSAGYTTTENALTGGNRFKDATAGGSYQFGPVKLAAAWREFKYTTSKQTNWLLAGTWVTGPHEFKASWMKADFSGVASGVNIGANGADQLGLGYVYSFSPRTALYATFARIDNKGTSAIALERTVSAGGASTGYELGLRHRF